MPPDALARPETIVTGFLAAVERRLWLVGSLRAATAAALAAAAGLVAAPALGHRPSSAWIPIAMITVGTAGVAMWRARARWSGDAVASLVERGIPESHNVVFTAREMLSSPHASAPWMQRRVIDRAASILGRASARSIVPVGRDAVWMAIAAAVAAAIALGAPARLSRAARTAVTAVTRPATSAAAQGLRLTASITPPAYTGLPSRSVTNPESLDVIQGSRIVIAVSGSGAWSIRFGARPLQSSSAGELRAELVPEESGYFAVERSGADGERRLLPVTVTADRAPDVRIENPGKDLLMPAARGTIALTVSAGDDFGLESLDLRYTKVSGSGEQFEFLEGSLPLSIVRESSTAWKAAGSFDLARLGLEPGDSLVYRALARDRRPGGAGVAASDTFFIEVAGPGQVALPGFELPPDRERYALSQQMIVLELQRLRAREATLSRDALTQEVETIAAEQRAVRANFIFLMGGVVEDEEVEAEQSNEIQEGRLENSARREINTAIRFMGRVEQALAAVDAGAALPPAKSAVDALQRAFGHNRYFLRTLTVRSRLDPSRRLTGDLKEASDWRRSLEPATRDPKTREARLLLARLLDLLPDGGLPPSAAAGVVGALAEQALAVDPGSPDWQRTSAALVRLRDALGSGRTPDEVRRAVREAVTPLVTVSRKGAVRSGDAGESADAIRSAWAAEARRR
jgi:Domain of unknown function (DUF4175)